METLILVPYVSVGSIKFGESRDKVRSILGHYREYKKNKFSKNSLDDFGFCQVFYNDQNQVEAVELYRNVELIYDKKNLFNLNAQELKILFNDPSVKENEYSLDFPSYGLSIVLQESLPDSILTYRKGYM